MGITQLEILTLIYKAEYYIINKDYEALIKEEYGLTFTNKNEANKIQCLRMLLKALKIQYDLDYTNEIIERLYVKVKEHLGLNLDTIPDINTSLIVYEASNVNSLFVGSFTLATYQQLLDNLPEDYDKVVSVKVFNQYFATLPFSTKLYRALITITDDLVINHNLDTLYISVSFTDTYGPIICDYEIIDKDNIKLISTVTIPNVKITILG